MEEALIESAQEASTKTSTVGRAELIKQAASEEITQGREKAKEFHGSAEDYVRAHPTKCVLGALGAGVLLGLIIRR